MADLDHEHRRAGAYCGFRRFILLAATRRLTIRYRPRRLPRSLCGSSAARLRGVGSGEIRLTKSRLGSRDTATAVPVQFGRAKARAEIEHAL